MRDISFRAWDKIRKIMYTGLPYSNAGSDGRDNFPQVLKHPMIYIVMQYTGLTDKSGVRIYEGDIIVAGNYKWKCKVVWDVKCARFIGLTNDKDTKLVYIDMVDKNNNSAVEVIGNIYENLELFDPQN